MKNKSVIVYDPHLLEGCDVIDMRSLKYVIRTLFNLEAQGCPFAPIKTVVDILVTVDDKEGSIKSSLKANTKTNKIVQNISRLNSRLLEMVFDNKSFVGSQIEISEAIFWKFEDLEKQFNDLYACIESSPKLLPSKDANGFIKKMYASERAFKEIRKQFNLILSVVTKSYNGKVVR